MASTTMKAVTLPNETVWLDKATYDKAERQHYEKLAKYIHNYPDLTVKAKKIDKFTNNKLAYESNAKFPKYQENAKINKDNADIQYKENVKVNEKRFDNVKEKEDASSEKSKKCNMKETKEKKNKEDTKNEKNEKNEKRDVKQNDVKKYKEIAGLSVKNKEQLSEQGIQESTCSIHSPAVGSLANEVAKARDHIKQSLQCMDDIAALAHVSNQDLTSRIDKLEKENQELKVAVHFLKSMIETLRCSMKNLVSTQQNMERFMEQHTEVCSTKVPLEHFIAVCPAKLEDLENHTIDNDNENFDLSMSNSDNLQEEGEIREDRLVECNAKNIKKSHKTCQIPKSVIIMDVKPWDDKTDVEEMEKEVRKIKKDGLVWGASTIAPLAFGIKKLQISCVVEDDKVSIDCLIDEIKELNKYVQSVDIVAFNKV